MISEVTIPRFWPHAVMGSSTESVVPPFGGLTIEIDAAERLDAIGEAKEAGAAAGIGTADPSSRTSSVRTASSW